jgi:PAS domain S-box-containing protein
MDSKTAHPGQTSHLPDKERIVVWRNRFYRLLERSAAPLAFAHSDGEVMECNRAMSDLFGMTPSELVGQHMLELLSVNKKEPLRKLDQVIRQRHLARFEIDVQWTVRDAQQQARLVVETVPDEVIVDSPLMITMHPQLLPYPKLSDRETEILVHAAAGDTTSAIAKAVQLSNDGVNYHLTHLCRSFAVPNRTALIAKAYALGLLRSGTWPPELR